MAPLHTALPHSGDMLFAASSSPYPLSLRPIHPQPPIRLNLPPGTLPGFTHLVGDVSKTGNRILALDLDESVEVDASELGGINIWLLETAARLGNFTVKYEIWRPPDSVNDRALQTIHALERGYDCVVTSVIHSYERRGTLRVWSVGRSAAQAEGDAMNDLARCCASASF